MREVEFRFWKENTKEMLNLKQALDYLVNVTDLLSGKYDNFKPLQYTGLKDKNGIKIFEGDILTDKNEVIFEYGCFKMIWHSWKTKPKTTFFNDEYDECILSSNEYEVIGNIYQHKHLLEEK